MIRWGMGRVLGIRMTSGSAYPGDVEVGAYASHEMPAPNSQPNLALISVYSNANSPPPMPLKQYPPRQPNLPPPPPQRPTINIINLPDQKPSKKNPQSRPHNRPHSLQRLQIPLINPLLLLRTHRLAIRLSRPQRTLPRPPPRRPQLPLHDIPPPKQHDRSQRSIAPLMKLGLLQIMIIPRDKHTQRHQRHRNTDTIPPTPPKAEGGVAGEAHGVDHAELVDELHGVF